MIKPLGLKEVMIYDYDMNNNGWNEYVPTEDKSDIVRDGSSAVASKNYVLYQGEESNKIPDESSLSTK